MDLIAVLEQTVSPDKNELEQAQKFLEQAAATDLPAFQVELAKVLAGPQNSHVARMASGLQLKNTLTSKDLAIKMAQQQRWLQLSKELRQSIKNLVLQTLGTELHRPSSAAQCVACIACAEIPSGQWPELIPQLVQNVTTADSTETLKESTLEAIGYICQDIDPDHLSAQSNDILTAIVQGMRKEEQSIHVKHAATNAMLNSLEFTKANFDKESERNVIMQVVCETTQCQEPQVQVAALQCLVKIMSLYYQHMEKYMGPALFASERHFIMQVVCETTQCSDPQVQVAALQCLVKIMSLYYQYMERYMGPALFAITLEAMKNEIDEIALQGIEFWSNVCDEEMDLAIELSEANEVGLKPEHYSRHYAKGALQYLVPLLLQTLAKQVHDDSDDDDEWNPCKAAGVCLMLLSNCCENDVLAHVLPFIKNNISSSDWRFRDASVMAFGSILEGPEPDVLKPLVVQALPKLIELLKDESVVVRDTVAWTLGRVCEMLPDVVLQDSIGQTEGPPYIFQDLLGALIANLKAEPRVAANVCWAFSSLAEAAFEANISEEEEEPETYELSAKYEEIVSSLLEATNREDAHQANLRSAAYEALMEMVKNSAKDCYDTVKKTTEVILERINSIIQMESVVTTASERVIYNDLQSLLCATLQSVLRRVRKDDAILISDSVMTALLQMFSSTSGKSGGVQEDALLAVGTLVEVLGNGFNKYMDAFKPYLAIGLRNFMEYQVCLAAVGLVGDICRAMNTHILPICDDIMSLLIENLGNDNVHRNVKPQILSVFGDIALAIGPEFKKYLEIVLGILQTASLTQVDKTDYDMLEYLNELREGCLEAYTGIVQGLKGDAEQGINPDVNVVLPHMEHMIYFIEHIAADEDHSDSNVAACAGLIGDLCTAFGGTALELYERQFVQDILTEGRKSKVTKTRTLATWATKEIRKLKN